MNYVANVARAKGDPRIVHSGPSSLGGADRLARSLGWFSIGLGLAELLAPRRITRVLGMEGQEALVRAYGAREIAAGVMSLSVNRELGLISRVAGDGLDAVTLMSALHPANPKRDNVVVALAVVIGIALVDIGAAASVASRHHRSGAHRDYSDRSGFPRGVSAARAAARERQGRDDTGRDNPGTTAPASSI